MARSRSLGPTPSPQSLDLGSSVFVCLIPASVIFFSGSDEKMPQKNKTNKKLKKNDPTLLQTGVDLVLKDKFTIRKAADR